MAATPCCFHIMDWACPTLFRCLCHEIDGTATSAGSVDSLKIMEKEERHLWTNFRAREWIGVSQTWLGSILACTYASGFVVAWLIPVNRPFQYSMQVRISSGLCLCSVVEVRRKYISLHTSSSKKYAQNRPHLNYKLIFPRYRNFTSSYDCQSFSEENKLCLS